MAVSASFHQNVFLLTQVIPPSNEFKKYFREGMFDKPNTAGFIHVSHYLLTVYDVERFKKLIQWPVTCKKTEAKYRNDVKDYLTVISTENPDLEFPPILTSHLFHAGGSKFIIIMWKLSQVVLRTYIRRETNIDVISAPKAGLTTSLSKKFIEEAETKISTTLSSRHRQLSSTEDAIKTVLEEKCEKLAKIKAEIFETEQSISNLVSNAPVRASIKKRLANPKDEEVIKMWKESIHNGIDYVKKRTAILKQIERISNDIRNVIISNSNNTKVLDAKDLTRIDSSTISEISLPPNVQCLSYHLYNGDKLVLRNFILLFSALLNELYQHLKLHSLKDFSQCLTQIEASYEDMKLVLNMFHTFFAEIARILAETQSVTCQKNVMQVYSESVLPIMNNILLMPSPLIKIDTDCSDEKNDLHKRLQLTPVEGAHKSLFSRHERENQNHTLHGSKLRENLLVSRINFDDTTSTNYEKQQSSQTGIMTPKTNTSNRSRAGKYSRLFATRATKLNRTANSSIMSIPYAAKANSTAIISAIGEMHDISEMNLDLTAKSMCNVSVDFETPEKLARKHGNGSANISERNDTLTSLSCKMNMLEIAEAEEEQVNDENTVRSEPVKSTRQSIGDLVKRYKKHL